MSSIAGSIAAVALAIIPSTVAAIVPTPAAPIVSDSHAYLRVEFGRGQSQRGIGPGIAFHRDEEDPRRKYQERDKHFLFHIFF